MSTRKRKGVALAASYNLGRPKCEKRDHGALSEFLGGIGAHMKWLVFSGSGLSADSGVSMFTSEGGLYDRAAKRYGIARGQKLFSFEFWKQRPLDAQAFFAEVFQEVHDRRPGRSYELLEKLNSGGHVAAHYTMNIDGLSQNLGILNAFEIHGNIRWLFCPLCQKTMPMNDKIAQRMKKRRPELCRECKQGKMRSRIVLYQDEDSQKITPVQVLHRRLKADLETADGVLWIGVSFIQAASIEYFITITSLLPESNALTPDHGPREGVMESSGKEDTMRHVLVNPDEDTEFYLRSGLGGKEVNTQHLRMSASSFLEALVDQLKIDQMDL